MLLGRWGGSASALSPGGQALLVRAAAPRVVLLKGLWCEPSKLLTQPTLKIHEFELYCYKVALA